MGTDTVVILSAIAVKTENLIPAILREPILAHPAIEVGTTTNLATMLCAIVIHIINGQNLWSVLTTAYTHAPVSDQHFLTKVSIPDHDIGFLIRLAANMFEPIAIRAKQLKSVLGKAVLSQPQVETMTTASETAMLGSVIINVVNRKKGWMRFATLHTDATIGSKNLITKLIIPLLRISMTTSANETTRFGRASKTLATHACLDFLHRTLTTLRILTSTDLLLLFRGQRLKSFTPFLSSCLTALWMSKIVIMAARFARDAKFVLASTFSVPVLGGSFKPLLTSWAILLARRDWTGGKRNIINDLVGECIEIKGALNIVLVYTTHAMRTSKILIVTPRDAVTSPGHHHVVYPKYSVVMHYMQ
jgi:hypothetical protein